MTVTTETPDRATARPAAPPDRAPGEAGSVTAEPSAPEQWREAGVAVVTKMVGELAYEQLLVPVADGPAGADGRAPYRVELPGGVTYGFRARTGALEAWFVVPGSVTRAQGHDGPGRADDPRQLILDARTLIGLDGARLADVLSELTATLVAEAQRLRAAPTAAELARLDYDVAERHLTGHPRIVLNKGRVGFSASDRRRYGPEAGALINLRWTAVRRDLASFRHVEGVDEATLRLAELGHELVSRFESVLATRGDPADYIWLPVHPWQWDEVVAPLYAAEVARGQIVALGESTDRYRAHQTIRTLANADDPTRRDVKTALSIRNTLVYRGLAQGATLAGPPLTAWLRSVHAADALLAEDYRFELIGEVASVSVRHPLFGAVPDLPYRFRETLGALWREPLSAHLAPGERAVSMATLPYRDRSGRSVLAHLVEGTAMGALAWLTSLVDLALTPLLHWLHRYGVGFCPHSQNLVLVVDDRGRPLRVMIKDFAQGVELVDRHRPEYETLGGDAAAEVLRWPVELLAQSIFSSVVGGQLRFLAEIAADELDVARPALWDVVRGVVDRYEARADVLDPDLDLRVPTIERVCLNREHLAGKGFEKVNRDDEFDVRHGEVPNPLHATDPDGRW